MTSDLEIPTLIARKRDGGELTGSELRNLLTAYLADEVDDAQIAALLMAGVIRGFSHAEAVALTDVLVASGDTVDLSGLAGPTVDKHSTGGVGDTTTLVVAPLLAAAGCQVAKLSGRGLGHTGGTLDKLESVPGFRVDLSSERLRDQVERVGIAVAAATQDLVPADKRLYALRDVTGTVASPALIASSVMSKKLAGGASHVLLDVKTGDGAFMADLAAGEELARLCVDIGLARDRRTGALVTDMSQPLGDGVGNALEVGVAIETLQGVRRGRLRELSLALTSGVLELTGVDRASAERKAQQLLDSGVGLEKFREWIAAQGGTPDVADRPWEILPAAPVVREWMPDEGWVSGFACRRVGELAGILGAGRQRHGDAIDPAVGLEVLVRTGDAVDGSLPAVRVHARSDSDAERIIDELDAVVHLSSEPVAAIDVVLARVGLDEAGADPSGS